MKIEWTMTTSGECERLEDVPKGATIAAIDDVLCIGLCENCGKPILDGETHGSDSEGVLLCSPCLDLLKEEP